MLTHGKGVMRFWFVLLIAITVSFATMSVSRSASAAEEIVIAANLALTGPGSSVGNLQQRGVQFAVAHANGKGGIRGRQIKCFYEDNQTKPDQAVLAFNRLVDLHKNQVSLSGFSGITLAIAPLATRKKVVVINPMAQSSKLENASPYLFNVAPMTSAQAPVLAKFLLGKLGKKTAGIIYENAAAGIDGKDDFIKAFVPLGGKILAEEPVEFGSTNYRPALIKLAAAKPDVVYVSMSVGFEPLARQVGQVENFPLGVGTNLIASIQGNPEVAGWYHTWVDTEVSPEVEAEYAKMFPGATSQFETSSTIMGWYEREYFMGTNIALTAIDKVLSEGGDVNGEAIRKAIFDIRTFNIGGDQITFDKNTASRRIQIVRIEKVGGRTRIE